MRISFLVVDSQQMHETGTPYTWTNRVTLKHKIFQRGPDKMCELRSAPQEAKIRYTTNGANPRVSGATYDGPFVVPRGTTFILANAELDGVFSEDERIDIAWDRGEDEVRVDHRRPATWRRRHAFASTRESYEFLERLKRFEAQAFGPLVRIGGEGAGREWLELSMYEGKQVAPEMIEEVLQALRRLQTTGQVQLEAEAVFFPTGRQLEEWVADVRTTLRQEEVRQ